MVGYVKLKYIIALNVFLKARNAMVNKQINSETIERIKKELYLPMTEKDSILRERQHSNPKSRNREEYQRDYTRIMYSSAFRRLQGKMQLLEMDGNDFIRNRLTHSLEVSQIARSIANDIGYTSDEVYVVEACSLAHDIGNPPFGHYGEVVLNRIIEDKCNHLGIDLNEHEGFEGNAQTLRVLTTLQRKTTDYTGLNLTNRTLLGVVKYFYEYDINREKYIYKDDYEFLNKLCSNHNIPRRTLDVQIMDLSDEIAYAAHDIEDTLKKRLFTIDEFIEEFSNNDKLKKEFNQNEIAEAKIYIEELVKLAKEKASGRSIQYNDVFCKELGSSIIYNLIRDIDVIDDNGEKRLGFKTKKAVASGLKKVTFACVNKGNQVNYYEKRGEIILTDLFEFFFNNTQFLPNEFKVNIDKNNEEKRIRPIIDYIAGMMDGYAIDLHRQIYGADRFKTYGLVEKQYYENK